MLRSLEKIFAIFCFAVSCLNQKLESSKEQVSKLELDRRRPRKIF